MFEIQQKNSFLIKLTEFNQVEKGSSGVGLLFF